MIKYARNCTIHNLRMNTCREGSVMTVQAVILDNDGCAQDNTERDIYYKSFWELSRDFGGRELIEDSSLRRSFIGIDIREVHRLHVDGLRLKDPNTGSAPEFEVWKTALDAKLNARASHAKLAQGLAETVIALQDRGIKVGIASSATGQVLTARWMHFPQLRARFDAWVPGDSDGVVRGKPSPHLLLQAADQIGVHPGYCVYVGDALSDIRAAHAAGMMAVGYGSRSFFEPVAPHAVIGRMTELLTLV